MRLIDADALKETFSGYTLFTANTVIEHIDEAPTVSLQDIYQEGHYDGHLEGYTKAINEEKPQGDLISRSALKEDIVKLCRQINASNGITVPTLAFTRVIDNAPTVERPQGEWIKTDGNSFECPFCHRLFDFGDNYCGFCGADMRKDDSN